jgi:transcriptional regulator with GAF, ATPase, and Fis domain
VIAATNRDLETAILDGKFRSDLFYRLSVFPIDTPPLRERKEDVSMLVAYFVQRYSRRAGKQFRSVSKKSLELLESYSWPGNVRELQNIIERSVIVCDTDIFSVDESWIPRDRELAARVRSESPRLRPTKQDRVKRERDVIEAALAAARGRVSGQLGAAAKLGLPPSTLESRIRSLQIDKHRFRHGVVAGARAS